MKSQTNPLKQESEMPQIILNQDAWRKISLDDIFRKHNSVILLINAKSGDIIDANIAAEEFYGYSLDEFCTMNIGDINTLTRSQVNNDIKKAAFQNQSCFTFVHKTAHGNLRNVEVHTSPLIINGEQLLMSIIFDITERNNLEILKEKSIRRYETLYNNNIAAIMVLEPRFDSKFSLKDFKCIDVNTTLEFIFKQDRSSFINRLISEISSNSFRLWFKNLALVYTQRKTIALENVKLNDNFYDIKISILETDKLVVFLNETTERVIKTEKLKQSEEQLKQIFNKSHTAFFLINSKIEIKKSNHAAIPFLIGINYKNEFNTLGNALNCTGSLEKSNGCGHGAKCMKCDFRKKITDTLVTKKGFKNVELEFERCNNLTIEKRYWLFSCAHLIIGKEAHVLVTIEDITEQKKLQSNLIVAQLKAEESDKLKTAFMNNMSHEIRTPLNSILGFSQLLRKSNIDTSEQEQYLELISNSGNRLLSVINNVIDLAKISTNSTELSFRSFNLFELFESIIDNAKEKYVPQKNSIKIQFSGEHIIYSDKHIIDNIATHIIDNAFKFTFNGAITIKVTAKQTKLIFTIADNGNGILETEQSNLFKPFTNISLGSMKTYDGLGLGLTISKGYLALLRGDIRIKSKFGRGTIVRVEIPIIHS